ncbi:hypothetical protein [Nocardia sp. Marseille-Q1738]
MLTTPTVRPADGDVVYGICTVGDGSRVLDKIIVTVLDWRLGTCLEPSAVVTTMVREAILAGRGALRPGSW